MKKKIIPDTLFLMMLVFMSLLLNACAKQTTMEDSDFSEFVQNDSTFFTIARTILLWEEEAPSGARVVYHHKSVSDGREYAEIKIIYSDQSDTRPQETAEKRAQIFLQEHVGKMPYYCIEEEKFQLGETIFQCFTFSVSRSNLEPANYYGIAFGYNKDENSCVYLFFSDEDLSFNEPDYLLSQFYP